MEYLETTPNTVARNWKDLSVEHPGLYESIVHPVLDARMCKVFKEVLLGNRGKR